MQKTVNKIALPGAAPSYTKNHPHYTELQTHEYKIGCMQYNLHTPENILNFSASKTPFPPRVVLYSHGNGCDIGDCDVTLRRLADAFFEENVAFFSYDYHGYGTSGAAAANLQLSETRAEAACLSMHIAFEHLRSLGYQPHQIYFYGVSIGTGMSVNVAAALARRGVHLGGVLLQSPFLSCVSITSPALAAYFDCVCANRTTNPNELASCQVICHIQSPILVLHGKKDRIIPVEHSYTLAALRPGTHLELLGDAGHNDLEQKHFPKIVECLRSVLNHGAKFAKDHRANTVTSNR